MKKLISLSPVAIETLALLSVLSLAACSAPKAGHSDPSASGRATTAVGLVGSAGLVLSPDVGSTPTLAISHARVAPGTGPVNLRQGPGTDFAVIAQLAENVEVPVVGMTASGDWLQLGLEGGPGWVYAPLVQIIGELPIPATDEGTTLPPISISDINLDRATEVVESFTGETDIQLEFLGQAAMPNAGLRAGWELTDSSRRVFWLDTETYSLVEMEPSPLATSATEGSKSIEELRRIAEGIALEHSMRFGALVDVLVYSEGDKLGQRFFFRWEDRTQSWTTMPPMLQVGLTSGGELFSWLNTLDLPY